MDETYFDEIDWEEEERRNRPSVTVAAAELAAAGRLSDALHELSWGDARVAPGSECGCFYCGSTFSAGEVDDWSVNLDGGFTALCPCCGIDSVLVAKSVEGLGAEFGSELLQQMRKVWFDEPVELEECEG